MIPPAPTTWTPFEAAHLLNRAGFGGSPGEISAFHGLGRQRAVESLLSPKEPVDAFPLPAWSGMEAASSEREEQRKSRREIIRSMRGKSAEEIDMAQRAARKEYQQEERRRMVEAQAWWFRRMLDSKAPLREKMTLFWHDHFSTSLQKVKQPVLLIRQNDLFRRNAFGSSRDLTQQILIDPAMLLYLDTQSSRKGKPNENFAREVMELFTLGEGNYTEQDIREAARAFTGYNIDRETSAVSQNRRQWDETDKTVFGKTGPFDGKAIIDLIFQKPEVAPFMTRKIWEFFVYEKPADAPIRALADGFRASGYNVGALLREIFMSREFYSEAAIRSQIKSPVQYTVELLKQLGIDSPPPGFPVIAGQQLGQILFMPPNVAGWDWGKAWINTNTLLARYNLAGFITNGSKGPAFGMGDRNKGEKIKGMGNVKLKGRNWDGPDYEKIAPRALRDDPAALVDSLIFRFFQGPLPDKARRSFIEYAEAKTGEILTNQETAELCHLILSTPYYQLC